MWRQSVKRASLPAVDGKLFDIACARLASLASIWLKYRRFRLICTIGGFFCTSVFIVIGGVRIAHIRAENCADSLVDLLGCISLHLLGAMRIHVQGGLDTFVPYDRAK